MPVGKQRNGFNGEKAERSWVMTLNVAVGKYAIVYCFFAHQQTSTFEIIGNIVYGRTTNERRKLKIWVHLVFIKRPRCKATSSPKTTLCNLVSRLLLCSQATRGWREFHKSCHASFNITFLYPHLFGHRFVYAFLPSFLRLVSPHCTQSTHTPVG